MFVSLARLKSAASERESRSTVPGPSPISELSVKYSRGLTAMLLNLFCNALVDAKID